MGEGLMSFGNLFSKIIFKETSRLANTFSKDVLNDRAARKVQAEYERRRLENEKVNKEKIRIYEEKIKMADEFLRHEVKLLELIEMKEESINSYYYKNYWLKNVEDRFGGAKCYHGVTLSVNLRKELVTRLNVKQFISHGYLSQATLDSTLEFILENTPVYNEAKIIQGVKGYDMTISTYVSGKNNKYNGFTLHITDRVKCPF